MMRQNQPHEDLGKEHSMQRDTDGRKLGWRVGEGQKKAFVKKGL